MSIEFHNVGAVPLSSGAPNRPHDAGAPARYAPAAPAPSSLGARSATPNGDGPLQADTRAAVHNVSAEPCAIPGCQQPGTERTGLCLAHHERRADWISEYTHDVGRGQL